MEHKTRVTWLSLAALTFVVAVLTYLQSRVLLQAYGAGNVLDSYYLAITLPMSAVAMFGVVVAALLVPTLVSSLSERGQVSGVGAIFGASGVVMLGLVGISLPVAVALGFAGGLNEHPFRLACVVGGAVAYGLSFVAQAYLVAMQRQWLFLAAQAVSNVAFIIVLISSPMHSVDLIYLAFLLGAVAQLAFSGGILAWAEVRVRVAGGLDDARHSLSRTRTGLIAVLAAVALAQGGVLTDRWFMKAAGAGAITCYLLADRIVQVVGTSGLTVVGLQAYPRMTDSVEGKRYTGLAVSSGAAVMVPFVVGLVIAVPTLVPLLFMGGKFTAQSAALSAAMLSTLVIALPAMAVIQIAPRRLQIAGKYWVHVGLLAFGLAVNIAVKLLLGPSMGAIGLVVGTAVGAFASATGYCVYLAWRDASFGWLDLRDLGASLACGVAALLIARAFGQVNPLVLSVVLAAASIGGMAAVGVRWVRRFASARTAPAAP